MTLSERNIKVLFIVIINVVLTIPFIYYLTKYYTKSYSISENNIEFVDSLTFKYVSDEIPARKGSRRIELTAINNHEFRIWSATIDAITDKEMFFDKVRNPKFKKIIYSDYNSAKNYKVGKSSFTTIEQIEIENVKYIDLNKVSSNEKNRALRYIFICPILALLLTLIFRYKLFRKT